MPHNENYREIIDKFLHSKDYAGLLAFGKTMLLRRPDDERWTHLCAYALAMTNSDEEALRLYSEIYERDKSELNRNNLIKMLLKTGYRHFNEGDYLKAFNGFSAILELGGENNVYADYVYCALHLGNRFDDIARLLDQAMFIAVSLYRQGYVTKAQSFFERILLLRPDSPLALSYLAIIRDKLGWKDNVLSLLQRAVYVDDTEAAAFRNLGEYHKRRREHVQAMRCHLRSMSLELDKTGEFSTDFIDSLYGLFSMQTESRLPYFSQNEQDRFLDEQVFRRAANGLFLDIGAYNGVHLSNTLFFERYRGWRGICVEPHSEVFRSLAANRDCVCQNCCVRNYDGYTEFLEVNGNSSVLSGIRENLSDYFMERINDFCNLNENVTKTKTIICRTVNSILEEYGHHSIDLCSIDTEGSEFEIVSSLDFERFNIRVFLIENNSGEDLREFMYSKNYELVCVRGDDIYVRKERFHS